MNTSEFFEKIDRRVDDSDTAPNTLMDWLEDEIAEDLGRPLQVGEMQIVIVCFYAGAMCGIDKMDKKQREGAAP
jgi:hypothetical protein